MSVRLVTTSRQLRTVRTVCQIRKMKNSFCIFSIISHSLFLHIKSDSFIQYTAERLFVLPAILLKPLFDFARNPYTFRNFFRTDNRPAHSDKLPQLW